MKSVNFAKLIVLTAASLGVCMVSTAQARHHRGGCCDSCGSSCSSCSGCNESGCSGGCESKNTESSQYNENNNNNAPPPAPNASSSLPQGVQQTDHGANQNGAVSTTPKTNSSNQSYYFTRRRLFRG
jgi:hypothetical protein